MNRKSRKMIFRLWALFLFAALSGTVMTSCSDKFDDEENNSPTWVGSNIYDYLVGRGDCNYFVRLINDDGQTMVDRMKLSGSDALFFYNDSAFERFFQTNTMGIRSYEQIPASMRSMFLKVGLIENAQLIERLSKSDKGEILLRRTTDLDVEDTIPVMQVSEMPQNSYFATLRAKNKPVKILQDATQWTLVQFFPDVMSNKGITDLDIQTFTGDEEATINKSYLFGNKVVNQDLICKNGYLHELNDVLTPPMNMAGYIRSNSSTSQFSTLMDRFACPTYYKKSDEGDSIYELRYFNTGKRQYITDPQGNAAPGTLIYDPGWNLYASTTATGTQAGYEQTMGCMFVPTNAAMAEFFSATGEGSDFYNAFGTWDQVPTSMVADIINSHMKNNFLTALPSAFDKVEDENGYSMNISASDVVNTYVGRNGIVFVTNKVYAPQDYKTVMGPAKIDVNNNIFNMAISNTSYSYYAYLLRAPKNYYYFFVTPDEYAKGYVNPVAQGYSASKRCKLDFKVSTSNQIVATPISIATGDTITDSSYPLGANGVVSSHMKNMMQDILGSHTIVTNSMNELYDEISAGQEYFISNSYAPVHISSLTAGGKVKGSGNSTALTIKKTFQKSNGYTFIVDGLIQSNTKSIYTALKENDNFSDFFNICETMGIFSTTSTDHNAAVDQFIVNFLNRYHYTVYVPTNKAIETAIKEGYIPSIDDYNNEGDQEKKDEMAAKLLKFVKYHFQDNSIFIKGKKETASYLSSALNTSTNKFYPITVKNTGNAITLTDAQGNTANVLTSGGNYNIMARDIVGNNSDPTQSTEILSYAYASIHQIDKVLRY